MRNGFQDVSYISLAEAQMNVFGFLNGFLHWRTPEKMRKVPRKTETTQEAAARALHALATKKAPHK